ncbi:MAG TPA: hypothetical protein VFQ58_03225 [Flavisolibacter sp.]|jgi:hypothetical protein|nr:hypothetical protein [Flavisolibacter sp.]
MEKDDLINKLEHMKKPEIVSETHQAHLKLTLMSARKSARIGIFLALIPVVFLLCIFLKYILHWNVLTFNSFENWMSEMDKRPVLKILMPLVLVGGPLLGLALNLLAILHVEWKKSPHELLITLRLKWKNIVLIIFCLLILGCFLVYAVGENR